ncbi:MAG: glutathione S-transferase N-terminal domain-containing protein [Polyangiaceae bacterium]|nr:glutathione S-transferase N-terminal domain-containing protein [Polyangiaceae bacterium]
MLAAVITLFGKLESGNVHKARRILRRAGIPYRRVEVSQARGEPRRSEYLRIDPIEKVPAVELDDSDVLTESGATCKVRSCLCAFGGLSPWPLSRWWPARPGAARRAIPTVPLR